MATTTAKKAPAKPAATKKMMIVPYGDRLVVQQVRQEEVLSSGIVIPDTAQEKPQEGEVIAVGPGRIEEGKRIAIDLKAGDRVLFSKYAGQEIKVGQEEYLVLKEADVLAKLQ